MNRRLAVTVFAILIALVSAGCMAGPGVYPNTGEPTVKGLPPVFKAGVWALPWDHDDRVDGLKMVISPDGHVKITQDDVVIPHQIKSGKIILGGRISDCFIYASGTDQAAAVVVAGWGSYGRHLRDLGQFQCKDCPTY